MHQTRSEVTTKMPIPRKGTKYVVRAKTDLKNSVPVLIALRDILHLARNAHEAKEIIKQKIVKINGRDVSDYHESIRLLNIFEADKPYLLTLNESGKFVLEPTSNAKEYLCKVIGKKILKGNKVQINLHNSHNVLTDTDIKINDSVYLDFSGKIKKHVKMERGKKCIITTGKKYLGAKGIVEEIKGSKCTVNINGSLRELEKKAVIVL